MIKIRGFFICLLFSATLQLISCDGCSLLVGDNPPVVLREFGKLSFYQHIAANTAFELSDMETVIAYCENDFSYQYDSYYRLWKNLYVKNITFKCSQEDSKTYLTIINPENLREISADTKFTCSPRTHQLYESNNTLENCANFISYGIGMKSILENTISPIGFCYDIESFDIKYAKYIANRDKYWFINKKQFNPKIVELDKELNNFEGLFGNSFMTPELFNRLYNAKKKENSLLNAIEFKYASIIQGDLVAKRIVDFEKLFEIVWWHELLEENWKNFQNVFKNRNQNVRYLIYTGTSNSITIPSLESCTNSNILQFSEGDIQAKAPGIIWSYFKSLEENVPEEFVIVAHNTPFYKTNSGLDLCEDMCHQIDWLKNSLFEKLHLMPHFGVVNCCRPEDVAGKLENFPITVDPAADAHQITTEANNMAADTGKP